MMMTWLNSLSLVWDQPIVPLQDHLNRVKRIFFNALYGLLLNEEQQLKRDEALNYIAPTTQFTHNSVAHNRGRVRGRGNRGRGFE